MNTNALLKSIKLQREQQIQALERERRRDDIFTIYIISTTGPKEEEEGLKKYEQHQSPTTESLSQKLQYPNREPFFIFFYGCTSLIQSLCLVT